MKDDSIYTDFKHVLEPLVQHGWLFTKEETNYIQMNKLYSELEEISIQLTPSYIHISLPIKQSSFSFYKRLTDLTQSVDFVHNYVSDLIT
jgi:hypothetical protein